MEGYTNSANVQANARERNYLISAVVGTALLVSGALAANVGGYRSAMEGEENPYSVLSKPGYTIGEDVRGAREGIDNLFD